MADRTPWEWVAHVLAEAGCGLVTGLPSDTSGLLDAALRHPTLRALPVRDQRIAACAAIGHFAVTGRPAVLALDSGPSFTNALTGVLEASSLLTPLVIVTTRIPVEQMGRGGFQQLDQRAVVAPMAKWTMLVEQEEQLAWALRRAVHLAINGSPGVTVVEISHEVLQRENMCIDPVGRPVRRLASVAPDDEISRAADLLRAAELPVLLAGGGAKAAGAGALLQATAERLDGAVFTTVSGRGAIDENHPLACGLVGLYTTPPAQTLLDETDLVFVVGSRLEETARMGWPGLTGKQIIQLDCDPAAFASAVNAEIALLGDASLTLRRLLDLLADAGERREERRQRIMSVKDALRQKYADSPPPSSPPTAASAIRAAVEAFGHDLVLVQENGLHDMWGYHYPIVRVTDRATIIAPGEQTMLGFGLGAALGAVAAEPNRPVLAICGDGAAEMSLAALPTLGEQQRGITILLLDNRGYGWPRLGRSGGSCRDITRFRHPSHAVETVRALGGWTAHPTTMADLVTALQDAREANAAGKTALILVAVDDDDIPIGVRRMFASPDHMAGAR